MYSSLLLTIFFDLHRAQIIVLILLLAFFYNRAHGANNMLKLNLPSVDMDAASEGVWFTFTDTISFKVARDGNPKHKRALQSKIKQIEKMREKGDYNRIENLTNELMVRYILKDWKGITEGDDKELPFAQDTALTILSDPQYEQIRNFIVDSSRDESEFETEETEIVKK